MTRRPRIIATERRAKNEQYPPGSVDKLTKNSTKAGKHRANRHDQSHPSALVAKYRSKGMIQDPDYGSMVSLSEGDELAAATLPIGQVIKLYNGIRTDEDRERFHAVANASLRGHKCGGARCLCGRLERLLRLLVDGEALANHVTPWLPDPRYRMPGSAGSNER